MKAININTGTCVEIISTDGKFFKGKIINDPSGRWKEGQYCNSFLKEHFMVLLEWSFITKFKKVFDNIYNL